MTRSPCIPTEVDAIYVVRIYIALCYYLHTECYSERR